MPPTPARPRPIYILVFADVDRSAAKFGSYGNRFIHEQIVLMCCRVALLIQERETSNIEATRNGTQSKKATETTRHAMKEEDNKGYGGKKKKT